MKIKKKEFVDSCPSKVFKFNEETSQVEVEDPLECTFCDECIKKAKQFGIPDLVQIRPKNDKFLFQFESTGSISPQQILLLAIGEIRKKLEKVQKNLQNIKQIKKRK